MAVQSGSEPPAVSSAEVKRRKCLSVGDLEGAAAAEVALLVAVLDAQFGRAQINADQGLITVQVGKHCQRPSFSDGFRCCVGILWVHCSLITDVHCIAAVKVDDRHVAVECKTGKVECADFALKARVEVAISRLMEALAPASLQE